MGIDIVAVCLLVLIMMILSLIGTMKRGLDFMDWVEEQGLDIYSPWYDGI